MNERRLRVLLLALIGSLALAAPTVAPAQTEPEAPAETSEPTRTATPSKAAQAAVLRKQIRKHRRKAQHWQRVMGRAVQRGKPTASSVRYLTWLRDTWRKRANRAHARAKRVPNRKAWLCIHRYEGPWNDPRPPYYGGLQMDLSFQKAYGRYLLRRKGTANRWKPIEQMWTAERARRSGRGFHPWPNTARRCGLI